MQSHGSCIFANIIIPCVRRGTKKAIYVVVGSKQNCLDTYIIDEGKSDGVIGMGPFYRDKKNQEASTTTGGAQVIMQKNKNPTGVEFLLCDPRLEHLLPITRERGRVW